MRSDEQLVNLFRAGSEEAFGVIHDRYRQRLYAYARQMLGGAGSDAEDVMQDVFLRAYRALRADERPVSLRAWLYRVAHNRCIDALRRPTPPASEIFEVSRRPVADPIVAAERREDLERLVADVRRLPDQQRSALLMREMDGLSYADLAAALETSVPAVKSLLVRARIGLVEAVEARDADCADIRHDLAASFDRGVRASGRARRHLRDCPQCTTYRTQLRGVRQGFAALSPTPAVPGVLAKLLGLGGAGSGGAAAAGGAASVGGGAASAITVSKAVAVVCSAAALGGGAAEVKKIVAPATGGEKHQARTLAAPAPAPARAEAPVAAVAAAAAPPVIAHRSADPAAAPLAPGDLALHPSPGAMPAAPAHEQADAGGDKAPDAAAKDDGAAAEPAEGAAPAADDQSSLPVDGSVLPLGDDSASGSSTSTSGSSSSTSSSSGTDGTSASSGSPSGSTSSSGSSDSTATTASTSGSSTGTSGSSGSTTTSGSSSGSTGPTSSMRS